MRAYVAIGDSQTEGLVDIEGTDGAGGYRGWADRFAEHVAAVHPHLQYANLAVRGRLIGQIRAEQLEPALALEPDLVTVMAGLNDVLRPGFDLDAVLGDLDAMLAAFTATGATVLTNTYPDIAAIAPLVGGLAPRVFAFDAGIRRVAAERGALLVDFAREPIAVDARIWSPDRIHANSIGHARMAAGFAHVLGLPGFDDWTDPLPAPAPIGRLARIAAEAHWAGTTVAPWMARRLRGRSSGDGVRAKRPALLPVAPIFHLVVPAEWPASGQYRPASVDAEGFVHCSFADQVPGPANRLFADAPDLLLVEFDAAQLASSGLAIRVEDSYGEGVSYPHVFGSIPVSAARSVRPLTRGADGRWEFSVPPCAPRWR